MSDEKGTGSPASSVPSSGQQHGSSSGQGGSVGLPEADGGKLEHPRPDTPESKVEHQADQPGVTSGGSSQGGPYPGQEKAEERRRERDQEFQGGQSEQAYHGSGQLGEQVTGEQPNAGSRR